MNITSIADATVTHGGSTYLASVTIQGTFPLQKLDLVSGRVFIWGFQQYNIVIQRILDPYGHPSEIKHAAEDVTVNGHTFEDCYPTGWALQTSRDNQNGKFLLQETLQYTWFKQNPPGLPA